MSKRAFALITFATAVMVVAGNDFIQWMADWPLWLLWGTLIGVGNMVYTTVRHNNHVERISLMMSMILLALLNLSWPGIAAATIIGVGLGEIFLNKVWYKKLYSIVAITTAAVVTEVIYTYTAVDTIMVSAVIMDGLLFLLYTPIWYFVAKETHAQVRDAYLSSFWTVPVSAVTALAINEISDYRYGIVFIVVALIAILRPRYEVNVHTPHNIW